MNFKYYLIPLLSLNFVVSSSVTKQDKNTADYASTKDFDVQLSDACWRAALVALSTPTIDTPFGVALCAHLSPEQQKLLALEMAKCHLLEMHMPLFEDESCAARLTEETLRSCLPTVTSLGAITYTQFLTSVTDSCTRLLLEELSLQQQKSAHYLAQVAEDATTHFNALVEQQLHSQRRSQELQANQTRAFWEGQERQRQQYAVEMEAQLLTHHAQLGVVISQVSPILEVFGYANNWKGFFLRALEVLKSLLWLMLECFLLVWITTPIRCKWVRKKLVILAALGWVINNSILPSLVKESVIEEDVVAAFTNFVDDATTFMQISLYLFGWIWTRKVAEPDHKETTDGMVIDRQALEEHLLAVRKTVRDELTAHRQTAPEPQVIYPVIQQIPTVQPPLAKQYKSTVVTPHERTAKAFWQYHPSASLALVPATKESGKPTPVGLSIQVPPSLMAKTAGASPPASPAYFDAVDDSEDHLKRPLETDEDAMEEEDDRPAKKQRQK